MPLIRHRKLFPADGHHPQQYLSKYSRAAVIDSVNTSAGTCAIRWLDNPGGRQDVTLLQGSWGEYNMPVKGAVVLCQFDQFDRTRIVRYANLNQGQRTATKSEGGDGTLPKLKPGEKYWESVGGATIYMTADGRVILSSSFNDQIELSPDIQQIKSTTVNWQIVTAAGTQKMGLVRRWLALSGANTVITDGIPSLTFPAGTPLTELVVSVNDKQNATTPVLKMTIGTVVDNLGNIIDKNSLPQVLPTKQLAARIVLSSGVQLDVDHDGRVSLKNVKLNINRGSADATDPDVALALEVNNATLGTKGQHAARQHDTVTVPCTVSYVDAENQGLTTKSQTNIAFLQTLASAIVSPAGPCFLNPSLLSGNRGLVGEITSGAANIILGDL